MKLSLKSDENVPVRGWVDTNRLFATLLSPVVTRHIPDSLEILTANPNEPDSFQRLVKSR